ncbi:MAG: pyridoxamine kinase [Ruminococcaceae bacterium]|nr:pyridoxamine kinase [Oscillospiraceae bacterium]
MKRCAAVHDISCIGKCSLTVALPVLSAMGIEVASVPTAVLSTHTAGFNGYTFHDLTDELPKITAHWKKENIELDAIYTGYLGSFAQLQFVSDMIDDFKTDSLCVVIDPVMADHGKLYTGFTPEFALEMGKLCAKADVIVPNLTEAAFMLGEEYNENYDKDSIRALLLRLADLGAKKVVLTGVSYEDDKLGCATYDSQSGEFGEYFTEKLPVAMHGTGDVYASAFTGAYMNGKSLIDAAASACDFTCACIKATMDDIENHWYSVKFEKCLHLLTNK